MWAIIPHKMIKKYTTNLSFWMKMFYIDEMELYTESRLWEGVLLDTATWINLSLDYNEHDVPFCLSSHKM